MDQSFLGRGWKFPPAFTSQGTVMVSDAQDIRESLMILLSTMPGERIMEPNYGCPLNRAVFEILETTQITYIKDLIEKAVMFFEPRVTLHEVEINIEQALEGVVLINLVYTVTQTNVRTNMVYPFYLIEGTDVRHKPLLLQS